MPLAFMEGEMVMECYDLSSLVASNSDTASCSLQSLRRLQEPKGGGKESLLSRCAHCELFNVTDTTYSTSRLKEGAAS